MVCQCNNVTIISIRKTQDAVDQARRDGAERFGKGRIHHSDTAVNLLLLPREVVCHIAASV